MTVIDFRDFKSRRIIKEMSMDDLIGQLRVDLQQLVVAHNELVALYNDLRNEHNKLLDIVLKLSQEVTELKFSLKTIKRKVIPWWKRQ